MKTFAPLTLLAATLLALPAAASAKPDTSRIDSHLDRMFERLDADGDGRITQTELDAHHAARFQEMDANGDGVVTQDEFVAWHQSRAEERLRERFAKLDADGSGNLRAEDLAGKRHFDLMRFDADGDRTVTREEIRDKMQKHKRGRTRGATEGPAQ